MSSALGERVHQWAELSVRLDMTQQMVLELCPEEELLVAPRTVVRPDADGAAVLLEHVPLEAGGGGEQAAAQVASERRTPGERVLDEVGLQLERRVELASAESARMQAPLREQMTGQHVRLDLGLGGEYLLALDALVAARRHVGRHLRVQHRLRMLLHHGVLVVSVQAVLAHVRLLPVRRHSVRYQAGRLEVTLAEAARKQRRLGLSVKAGVQPDLDGQAERLAAHEASEWRAGARSVRRRLQVRVVRLLGGQRDATGGAHGGAGHFAVRQLVLGEHGRRRENLVADVALDPAASVGRRRGTGRLIGTRTVHCLHVGLEIGSRLAGLAAIGAVQAQVEDGSSGRGFRFVFRFESEFFRNGRRFLAGLLAGLAVVIQVEVPLEQELDGERKRTVRALERRLFGRLDARDVHGRDVSVEVGLVPEHGGIVARRARGAAVHLRLAAVLHGEVHLNGHLRVERLLAQRAPVQVVGVHVEQVLLQLVRRREALHARRAAVLVPRAHQMGGNVRLERVRLRLFKLGRAVRAAQAPRGDVVGVRPPLRAAQIRRHLIVDCFGALGGRRRAVQAQHVGQAVRGQRVLLERGQVGEAQAAQLTGVQWAGLLAHGLGVVAQVSGQRT